MDHLVVGFLIYAMLFRLAVIAAGMVAVVLGYKLFVRGVTGSEGGGNVGAEAGPIKLTLANAGPGLGFALFGAFIVAVMLFQGSPQLALNDIKILLKDAQQAGGSSAEVSVGSALFKGRDKGAPSDGLQRFKQMLQEGKQLQQAGDMKAAIQVYNKVLSESDSPFILNELALIYREENLLDEAQALAHAAALVDQKDPSKCFDTLALILLDKKEYKAAEQAAQKAVDLNHDNQGYKKTLQQVRAAQEAKE
jgi:tetratricopeptide (TPR) repeat protein